MSEDTICALSTPPINSSIAIIRISGSKSLGIANLIFSNKKNLKHGRSIFGTINNNSKKIDDVLLTYYKSPNSYTGEDVIEIFPHGNQLIVKNILNLLLEKGARIAEPGEFSKRAFLNGKIDLTEAEAINHIITAKSQWEIDIALNQMHGSLRQAVNLIRDQIIKLNGDIEAGIDFIEENIEFVSYKETEEQSLEIEQMLKRLYDQCKLGDRISDGIDVAITGKPNVGKSSILNYLLNHDRAIVSDIPGTTRDLIKESIQINGMQINLIDTAGINNSNDTIEKIGIELSYKNIETASIVLFILDPIRGFDDIDENIMSKLEDKKKIFIINKTDISDKADIKLLEDKIGEEAIKLSAKTGSGFDKLESRITEILTNEFVSMENLFVADMRMLNLFDKSLDVVKNIISLIRSNEPVEIIAFELNDLRDILSDITGEITSGDILNSIFSRFCIGK